MSRDLAQLIGSSWMPEDDFYGDLLFLVVDTIPNRDPDPDVLVLDCQTGKTITGYYDPFQKPSDPEWEVLICTIEKDGRTLGPQYLLPIRDR